MLEQKTLDLESGRSEDGLKTEVEDPLVPTQISNEEEVPLISRLSHVRISCCYALNFFTPCVYCRNITQINSL